VTAQPDVDLRLPRGLPATAAEWAKLAEDNPDLYRRLQEHIAVVSEMHAQARDSDRREPLPDSPGALAMQLNPTRHIQRAHHNLIDEQFMAGERERGKRVIINIGPRYGKTNQLRWGCLHRLAKNPDRRIIYASYAAELAEDSSRWVRDQLESHDLGPRPRRDSRAVDRWWLDGSTGGMLAAGIGGGITGFGADDLVIDDVIKDHEQAYSTTWRKKVWDWYTQTAYDRLEPDANVWIVMTRWHPDDLTGRLLKEQPGVWTVIRIPTVAEPGDPLGRKPGTLLWPERYSESAVAAQRQVLGPFGFGARHQQDPKVNTGGVWDEDNLRETRVDPAEVPRLRRKCVSLDPSASDVGRDEAGITVQALSFDGHVYVLEDLSGRLDPDTWARRALITCLRHDCDLIYEQNLTPVFMRRTLKQAWAQIERDFELLRAHLGHGRKTCNCDEDALISASAEGLDRIAEDRQMLGPMPDLKPVRAMVGKQLRAEPVAQLWRQRRAHIVGRLPLLEQQMVGWVPGDDSPDRLDAMVHGATWLADAAQRGQGGAATPAGSVMPMRAGYR
jgi:hypothetical protein